MYVQIKKRKLYLKTMQPGHTGPLKNASECHALPPVGVNVTRMYEGGGTLAERDFQMFL